MKSFLIIFLYGSIYTRALTLTFFQYLFLAEVAAVPKIEEKEVTSTTKFGFPPSQTMNYSITECRTLIRFLACGVKTITFRIKV